MASPVIYAAIDDTLPKRDLGEESEKIIVGDRPELGDTLSMGSDREWRVTRVEAYRSEGKTVYVATVVPDDQAADVEAVPLRVEYPSLAFSVLMSPEQEVITYAWEMEGQIPSGRLEGYKFGEDGEIVAVPLEWVIDSVQTCTPDEEDSTYAQIHLCLCRNEAVTVPTEAEINTNAA